MTPMDKINALKSTLDGAEKRLGFDDQADKEIKDAYSNFQSRLDALQKENDTARE